MLVIISDLHLQHTRADIVRYVVEGQVRETGVRRNVAAAALTRLLRGLCERAERHASTEIEIVLAGDIFEMHRTPLWGFGGGFGPRPWDDPGGDNQANPLRQRVLEVLEAVREENAELFAALRRFKEEHKVRRRGAPGDHHLPGTATVSIHYLPGNHDRLLNIWPSVRRRVREILGVEPVDGKAFPWKLDRPVSQGYGVRIRHGHEYDRTNFAIETKGGKALAAAQADYIRPCLGDWATIEAGTRIALSFRVFHAGDLRRASVAGKRKRWLYTALTEFDDVRPMSLLIEYLAARAKREPASTFRDLRKSLRDLYETALSDPFLRAETRRLGHDKYFKVPYRQAILGALKHVSGKTIVGLIRKLVPEATEPGEGPADVAWHEPGLGEGNFTTVVAGHTHRPAQVPLRAEEPETIYIDSGTWRTTLPAGVQSRGGVAFGRLRAYTTVYAYHEDERKAVSDGRRFETWTGHLAADDYGVYDEERGPLDTPTSRVRFTELRVKEIDEGKKGIWRNGAELVLDFGVDHHTFRFRKEKVHNGDRFPLAKTADLHSMLEGEVWAHGYEEDGGRSVIDMDDPLPWAIDQLPRGAAAAPDRGAYLHGPGRLRLKDRIGNHLVIRYEVEASPAP